MGACMMALISGEAAMASCDVVGIDFCESHTVWAERRSGEVSADVRTRPDLLEKEGVEFLFAPSSRKCIRWPRLGYRGRLSDKLDGRSRPTFSCVTTQWQTVSHRRAGRGFLCQKDAAQVAIIRRMVRDLNVPVEIVACPIVRDADACHELA